MIGFFVVYVAVSDNLPHIYCNMEPAVEMEVTTQEQGILSDESDDELLVPPMFLYEAKPFNEIRTPNTVHTPINDDLSPITPVDKAVQNSKKKKSRKLCFSRLVKEKAAQDEIDSKLSNMNEELKAGLENGKGKFCLLYR